MGATSEYVALKGSVHPHPKGHKKLGPTKSSGQLTVTIILRRKTGSAKQAQITDRTARPPTHDEFVEARGADQDELNKVVAFAKQARLEVVEADAARRTVVARGSVADVEKAFALTLNDYQYEHYDYRSHDGAVNLPSSIADYVEAVVGLTNRPVRARHFSTARRRNPADPTDTKSLTPQQVATLYGFPPGDGEGQTIGLYEMETNEGPAGYTKSDIAATMAALGGLPMPNIVDVPVDGVTNSGRSDGETGLDITVAGAIAPKATIVVYFAGGQTQNIIHALQAMIHPTPAAPVPTIISISYGWGPDDIGADAFSDSEFLQISSLFEDAASNKITVFVSSGDSGARIEDPRQAQASYPASDIWVTACGGTTIGNVNGASFDEWVWNDTGAAGPGATGGGVSARFPVPGYQSGVNVPKRNGTGQAGRGVPDIAGNASENSGYLQVIGGRRPEPVGGTSAVAPLYAGLVARINSNLGFAVGYLNPTLYALRASAFRDVLGSAGPVDNSFGNVRGYPAGPCWDACTGLGTVRGQALQDGLASLDKVAKRATAKPVADKKSQKA